MRSLIFESKNGVGDSLTLGVPIGDAVTIEIDEPWSGDTETGFGTTCRWYLSVEQMKAVIAHLQEAISKIEGRG